MPPPKCIKCTKSLSPRNNPGITCIGCDIAHHFTCSTIPEGDWPLYSAKPKPKAHICPSCTTKQRRSATFSTIEPARTTPKQPAKANSTSTSDELAELREKLNTVIFELGEAKARIALLESQQQHFAPANSTDLSEVKARITQLETQQPRQTSARSPKPTGTDKTPEKTFFFTINGVPETPGESAKLITEKVLSTQNANFKLDDSVTVKRQKSNSPKHHSILIGVRGNSALLKTFNKARGSCIKGNVVNLPAERIHINESHSSQSYRLFRKAKQLRTQGYDFVWIRSSRVFAQKTAEANRIAIKDEEQLKSLLSPDT